MRLQFQKSAPSLCVWIFEGQWHRMGPFVFLHYAASYHAVLNSKKEEVIYYQPSFQSWKFAHRQIKGPMVQKIRFTPDQNIEDTKKNIYLWILQNTSWEILSAARWLEYDCIPRAIGNEKGTPMLFFSPDGNSWSTIHPVFQDWSVKQLVISTENRPPSLS